MTLLAQRFAAEALGCVGSPFRLHGRNPMTGLDCVGLALVSLAACSLPVPEITGYRLRQLDPQRFANEARRCGLVDAGGGVLAGDILLCRPGPGQVHLAIAVPGGSIVHAHAGLGRVVIHSIPPGWPMLAAWRIGPELEKSWQP